MDVDRASHEMSIQMEQERNHMAGGVISEAIWFKREV